MFQYRQSLYAGAWSNNRQHRLVVNMIHTFEFATGSINKLCSNDSKQLKQCGHGVRVYETRQVKHQCSQSRTNSLIQQRSQATF